MRPYVFSQHNGNVIVVIIILHSGKLTYKRQQRLPRRIAGVVPQ